MKKIKKSHPGKIILPHGSKPTPHELDTAYTFTRLGKTVEFICPSKIQGSKSPDIILDNLSWEIKCPRGNSRWTIEEQLKRAAKQSTNVILDTRRTKMLDAEVKRQVARYFSQHKTIKRLILILKNENTIDFYK